MSASKTQRAASFGSLCSSARYAPSVSFHTPASRLFRLSSTASPTRPANSWDNCPTLDSSTSWVKCSAPLPTRRSASLCTASPTSSPKRTRLFVAQVISCDVSWCTRPGRVRRNGPISRSSLVLSTARPRRGPILGTAVVKSRMVAAIFPARLMLAGRRDASLMPPLARSKTLSRSYRPWPPSSTRGCSHLCQILLRAARRAGSSMISVTALGELRLTPHSLARARSSARAGLHALVPIPLAIAPGPHIVGCKRAASCSSSVSARSSRSSAQGAGAPNGLDGSGTPPTPVK